MGATKRRYSKEEFARRGEAVFEEKIRAWLKGENPRHFPAIDIETGDYQIDKSEIAACASACRTRRFGCARWARALRAYSAGDAR